MSASLSHSAREARRRDRDRFICALFAPAERRQAVYSILAFNAELARIRGAVSEPILGEMRLQWWRDAIAALFDDPDNVPSGNPVLSEFASAVRKYRLPRPVIDAMIDARAADLIDAPHADLEALLAYAGATSGGVTELTLHALGAYDDPDVETGELMGAVRRAGAQLGAAWALIGLIRAHHALAAEGRTFIPRRQLATAGLSLEQVVAGEFSDELRDQLQLLAGIASQYVLECRSMRGRLPKGCIAAFLPANLAWRYLQRLRRARYNPAGGVLERRRATAQLSIILRALTGRF